MSVESDDLDRASELTMQLQEAALAEVMRAAAPQQVQADDGSWPNPYCVDCDDELPTARLRLGRIRCVHCQDALERGQRRPR